MRPFSPIISTVVLAFVCVGILPSIVIAIAGGNQEALHSIGVIESLPSCPECEIAIAHVTTLGAAADEALVCHSYAHVALAPNGSYYVAPSCNDGEVLNFSADGSLRRTLNVVSSDPLDRPVIRRLWVTRPHELYVVSGQDVHSVFNSDGRLVRTWRSFPLPFDIVTLSDGRTVQQLVKETRDEIGLPLHIVDREGQVVRSFGSLTRYYRRAEQHRLFRAVGRAGNDAVWSAALEGYVVERWGLDGALEMAFSRALNDDRNNLGDRAPWIHDLVEDADGHLWVTVTVPSGTIEGGDPNERFDTVIDVIDPETKTLVTSSRNPLAFSRWLDGTTTYSYSRRRENPASFEIDVWHLSHDARHGH